MSRRILLGQLGARGDCLYATTVARQIKADEPDCHLTWAVGSHCRPIVEPNPYVDEVWEVYVTGHADMAAAWYQFKDEALRRRNAGQYDAVYFTQIDPDNYQNYDGTVRASIFRGYPRPIRVPVQPVVRLDPAEVARVEAFVATHRLTEFAHVILFEFSSKSGQSFVDETVGLEVARRIVADREDTCVVLSSDVSVGPDNPRIVDGSVLSFLANAELVKSCNLLIGCSSGISWLCTSDWAEMPPTIQLLERQTSVFASLVHDHEYQGLDTSGIIEMTNCPVERIAGCVDRVLSRGFARARSEFHERIVPDFRFYGIQLRHLVRQRDYRKALGSARVTLRRYGWNRQLLAALFRVGGTALRR